MRKFLLSFILSLFLIQSVFAQSPFGEPVGQAQNPGQAQDAGQAQNPGDSNAVEGGENASDGSDNRDQGEVGFWQSILETLGINNQSTDKNDETASDKDKKEVDIKLQDDLLFGPDKDDFDSANKDRLLESYGTKGQSNAYCKLTNKTVSQYLKYLTCIIVILLPIVVAATVLYFMWGSFKLVTNVNEAEHSNYKVVLFWGILILFLMLSFVGILALFGKTLGV